MFLKKNNNCHNENASVELDVHLPVITLIGQPNSGKTTLFNTLTGSHYKTANYAGATVEYASGKLTSKFETEAIVIDSPGIISLNPSSPEEEITINALFKHEIFGMPNLLIVTVDSTQLSRHLFLAKQTIDSGFNTIIVLTMNDLMSNKGLQIDSNRLSELMGCKVVKIDARSEFGMQELTKLINESFKNELILDRTYKINHQKLPTVEDINDTYKFTEIVEESVITKINRIDIEAVNKKIFKNLNRKPDERSVKIDKTLLHPVWGMIIFLVTMGLIFTSIFWLARPLIDLISSGISLLADAANSVLPESTWYSDLISNGIIKGVGSVAVFLPQIVILFLFLGLLEDTGYLARSAMLVDKPLSKIGLNGRSFIPMLSGFACAIPATMAARTITNKRERYLTILILPLMTCSARLPVYALLLAFLTPPDKPYLAGLGLGAIYFFSLISSSVVAGMINKFDKKAEKSTFMLELPAYRMPVFKHVLKNTYYRSSMYVKKAGPTIFMVVVILWMLAYFPDINPDVKNKTNGLSKEQTERVIQSERLNHSYSSYLGKFFEPAIRPLGWDWRVAVSLISAFAAREVFVSALAISFSAGDGDDDNLQGSLIGSMRNAKFGDSGKPLFTTASIISLIIYFMFAMQCLATVAVVWKETKSWKVPMMQIVLYSVMAYVFAFIAYNGLHFIGIN